MTEPRKPNGLLQDQVAIVTGGAWNIGRAISLAFAGAGARVVVASRNTANIEATVRRIEASGGVGLGLPTDATRLDEVQSLVDRTVEKFGSIDILAAIAGGSGAHQPIDEVDPLQWSGVLAQNLGATFNCARAVLPILRQKNQGVILTCAGGGAFFPWVGQYATAYACAKAAICRFTDQLQAECLDTGIRINCIEPGMVWSPETLQAIEAEEACSGKPHPDRAINRSPDDAAELALFLASSESNGLRGRIVSVADSWWRDPQEVRRVEESVKLYRLRRVEE